MEPDKTKEEFKRLYSRYQTASLEVNNARRELDKKLEALLTIAREQAGEMQPTVQRDRLQLSAAAAEAIDQLSEAHLAMAGALHIQASALRMTAHVGLAILDAREPAGEPQE